MDVPERVLDRSLRPGGRVGSDVAVAVGDLGDGAAGVGGRPVADGGAAYTEGPAGQPAGRVVVKAGLVAVVGQRDQTGGVVAEGGHRAGRVGDLA